MTGRARSKKMSVPPRRGPKKREGAPSAGSRVLQWTLAALGLLAFVTAVLLLFAFPAARGPGTGRDVELDVPGGESTDVLVARLVAAGLTDSPRLFGLYLRLTGGAGRVVPGVHLLTDDLPAKDVMARLERSMSSGRVRVTIPEGWTVFDISRRLQTMHVCTIKSWLDAVRAPTILAELHIPGESAKAEFDKRYAAIEGRHAPGVLDLESSLGWATRDVVTLASMVEKEAAVDEERATIASVFLNRLRDPTFSATSGKYLQCDPTAGYGCLVHPERAPSCLGYSGKITHDIVADAANSYNTYKHEGLPPGPIANPGAKSLEAVLAPSTTHYFYFVARGEGHHTFSETYSGHSAAVHGSKSSAAQSRGQGQGQTQ